METLTQSIFGKEFQFDSSGKKRVFYVCSYGGSGSKMLCRYLKYFGSVYHIHSRNPPNILEYIGCSNVEDVCSNITLENRQKIQDCYLEWFSGVPISEEDLEKNTYIVIYIYRNPIKAIRSRFWIEKHLDHIQTSRENNWENVIMSKDDLWGVEEFYQNYTTPNKDRRYPIYCIKYECIFKYINNNIFNEYFGLPIISNEYKPKQQEKKRKYKKEEDKIFNQIYINLIEKMKQNPWIFIA